MPKLIAKDRFFYAGRNVEAGEEFEALEQDVPLLTNSVSPRARQPGAPAEPASDARPLGPRGSRHNRRDLRARD